MTTIDMPGRMQPGQYQERRDRMHSQIVDKGVALQQHVGTLCAVEYMKTYGIGATVIQRVLLHPSQRRDTQR